MLRSEYRIVCVVSIVVNSDMMMLRFRVKVKFWMFVVVMMKRMKVMRNVMMFVFVIVVRFLW